MSKRLDEMIAALRAEIATSGTERATESDKIEAVRAACLGEKRDPSDDEASQVRAAEARKHEIDTHLGELRARLDDLVAEKESDEAAAKFVREQGLTAGVHVREQRTYRAGGEFSFFRDAFNATNGGFGGDARERIEQHIREARVDGQMSERAQTTGGANGLVIPQYLIDQYALVARSGRPTANVVTKLELPGEGMSIIIPRGTTGASVASQSTENTAASSTDEVWATLTVPVVTIAGQQDVSTQLLQRGGAQIDQIIFADLAAAYAVELDRQVLVGSGSSNQMLGILSTSGINQATAFTAAVTTSTFYTKVAGQINAVETTRYMAPDVIVMHPRRWNWLMSQLDSNGRPLVVPNAQGPFNALGATDGPVNAASVRPAGWIQGIDVITDASVPTAVGTGPEDQVLVMRKEDLLLWEENSGAPSQIRFDQTLGGQLTTKLVAYGYAAFTAGRYPTAVGVVGGNAGTAGYGLIAPTF